MDAEVKARFSDVGLPGPVLFEAVCDQNFRAKRFAVHGVMIFDSMELPNSHDLN